MTELNKEVLGELIRQARVSATISLKMAGAACASDANEYDRECAHYAVSDAHTTICDLEAAFKRLTV